MKKLGASDRPQTFVSHPHPALSNPQCPTEAQKLVFTVATVSKVLHDFPSAKVLVVVRFDTAVTLYACQLQQCCKGQVRAQQLLEHQLRTPDEFCGPNPNTTITTISHLTKAITSNHVQLQSFACLLLDHPFEEDELYASVLLISLQWGLLPQGQRPVFVDLFSLGKRRPPTVKVGEATSCPEDSMPKSFPGVKEQEIGGEPSGDVQQASAGIVVPANQLDSFLAYLKSLDWRGGMTMTIFVEEPGFGALLVYLINEELGHTIAQEMAATNTLNQGCQIAVLPRHMTIGIPGCDVVASIDMTGNVTVAQNQPSTDIADTCIPEMAGLKITAEDVRPEDYMPYPYQHPTGHKVDIFNCLSLLLSYCRAVLQDAHLGSAGRHQFFQYRRDQDSCIDVLHSVTYPSPKGPIKITTNHVHTAWAGRAVLDIITPEQCKSIGSSSVQQRFFVYVAVMDMVLSGYLDVYNNPTPLALAASTLHTWNASSRAEWSHNTASRMPTVASSSQVIIPAVPLRPQPVKPSRPMMQAWLPNKDPKSLLNELQHKIPNLIVAYDTVRLSERPRLASYQATVYMQRDDRVLTFQGEPCSVKKNAEKSAALAALQYITNGGLVEIESLDLS